MNIGIKGTGCDIELDLIGESLNAFYIKDSKGHMMWLPKTAFDDDGELNEYGQILYHQKI